MKQDNLAFQAFKTKSWDAVSPSCKTPEQCNSELKKRFSRLSSIEKSQLSTPLKSKNELYCLCRKEYRSADPTVVQCNFCKDWFHHTCIKVDEDYINVVPRFHCKLCLDSNIRNFTNFLYHYNIEMQELENSFIELKYKVWQEMSLAGRSVAASNGYPRHQLSIEYLSPIAQSNNGIKNDHNNCWMSSILQILCGTDI